MPTDRAAKNLKKKMFKIKKKNFEKDSDRYFICNRSKRNVNEGHEHVTAQRQAQCEHARITRSSLRILFGRVLENEKKERIPSTRHDSRRIPCHINKKREEKIVTFGCAPEKRRGKK
jgi:hypothetical protein